MSKKCGACGRLKVVRLQGLGIKNYYNSACPYCGHKDEDDK